MPKPRTNDEAIAHWASFIQKREPAPCLDVNSIRLRGDTIMHYGEHWPMAVLDRDKSGRVRRIFLNSNSCASGGWGPGTNSVQYDVAQAARAKAPSSVKFFDVPMGADGWVSGDGMIACKPNPTDPRPDEFYRSCEIPTVFYARDPGPEPVDDGVGCIAGQREEYSFEESHYDYFDPELRTQDQAYAVGDLLRAPRPGDLTYWEHYVNCMPALRYIRAENGVMVWGENPWFDYSLPRPANMEYKQCPHCAAFQKLHARWNEAYHGGGYGSGHMRGKGYKLYAEMMETYGTVQEWREARLTEFRRVRKGREDFKAWYERNHMPASLLPRMGDGDLRYVPRIDLADGHPYKKDSEAFFRQVREAARRARRQEREREARRRYERQVERFARGMRKRRPQTFTAVAANVARELAEVRQVIETTNQRLESQDATR